MPDATATPAASTEAVLSALGRLRLTSITAEHLEAECAPARPSGQAYRVRVGPGSRWACSCPRAVYGGRRAAECKHAAALRVVANALPPALRGDWR